MSAAVAVSLANRTLFRIVVGDVGAALAAAGDATQLFKNWTATLANWVEIVAAAIIAFAVLEATIRIVVVFVWRRLSPEVKEALRLHLARWLAVSLEFELAADILRTAIAPTWDEIGKLAAIATIRTLLNYFLEKEIQRAAGDQAGQPGTGPSLRHPTSPWNHVWRQRGMPDMDNSPDAEGLRHEPSSV